ncbi:MAG: type IX secretion system membrane protein PorP/SprF [Bacteroidota bacterium]
MKKIVFLLIAALSSYYSAAQQQATYSNYLMNEYFYNPAIAGSKDVHIANLQYRNQWVGFDGAPSNFNANFYGSVKDKAKHGYGVSITNERAGLMNSTGVYVDYAYHFKLGQNVKLGLGVRPGYVQYRVRLYDAVVADQGDDVVTGSVYSANAFDVNTGFQLYSKKFFVMGSVQHLLTKAIKFTSFNSNLAFHYNFIAGYNISFKKSKLEIQPSVMVKYVKPIPVQYSAMLKTTFNKKYWFGLIYRSDDAVGVSLGMTIKERFNLAYGYDYSISPIRKYNAGSHEVGLSFILTKKKPSLEELDEKLNNSILDEMNKESDPKKQ